MVIGPDTKDTVHREKDGASSISRAVLPENIDRTAHYNKNADEVSRSLELALGLSNRFLVLLIMLGRGSSSSFSRGHDVRSRTACMRAIGKQKIVVHAIVHASQMTRQASTTYKFPALGLCWQGIHTVYSCTHLT